MNRIDLKLGTTIILLLISVLLPLGFVINQIFYSFYIQQSREEALSLSSQYASVINDSTIENRLEVVEVAARISNQKMLVLNEEGDIWADANLALSSEDIAFLLEHLNASTIESHMANSFQATDGITYLVTASLINVDQVTGHVLVFSSLESILQSTQTVQHLLVISVVGSLLLGGGLAYFMSKKLSQPLVRMEKAARQIAKGKLDTRIREGSKDEIGSLAWAINDLAADLERMNKQRREFFANISHELQTPITYLKGYAKALREGLWTTKDERNQYLNIIEDEATRLSYLMNDLFDLAKIDDGRITLHLEDIELDQLIEQVSSKTSYRALEKGITLTAEHSALEGVTIWGDPLRMEQVLLNIVENAIRYTPHGRITISVLCEAENVKIKVEDTGIGINKEELPYIFDRFYRVEKSRSRAYGGTGLGLSIVKQLIELHQGSIHVDSTIGQGTTVTITLPQSSEK